MLKGERVTLRAVQRDDLRRMHELQRNVDLVLFGFGAWQPRPLAAFEKMFDRQLEGDADPWFAIEIDGTVVGDTGLHDIDRRSRVAALGIGIYDPAYVGKGYGREACALLLDWAFRIQNYTRIWLDTMTTNERAIRTYRALGFVEEGRQRRQLFVDGQYVDMVLMGLLREEWFAGDNHSR
jgi:RimJ/RimL family protein N-acetyltransferase